MKDINGKEIKTGDYIFYSELPYSDYADSIGVVVEEGGKIAIVYKIVRSGESSKEYTILNNLSFENELELMKYTDSDDIMIIPKCDISGESIEKYSIEFNKIIGKK